MKSLSIVFYAILLVLGALSVLFASGLVLYGFKIIGSMLFNDYDPYTMGSLSFDLTVIFVVAAIFGGIGYFMVSQSLGPLRQLLRE